MKKRLLVENDVPDMDDFQKILLLNKRKLSYDDVEFRPIEYKNRIDDNRIEVKFDGLLFDFDDLDQFLQFFFPNEYENGTDGEWDAQNYDRMYYGSFDFEYDCYDRSSDDWSEGYSLGYFCEEATIKLKELLKIISPRLANNIPGDGKRIDDEGEITKLLDTYFKNIGDEIIGIICNAKSIATTEAVKKAIEEEYCEGLQKFGIEKFGRWCFGSYFMSWGSLVQLFIEKGDFDENAIDLMINTLHKQFRHGLPESYEMESYYMDDVIFKDKSCDRLVNLIDRYIEEATDEITPEYKKAINKLLSLNLFNRTEIPGQKNLFMKVEDVDSETMKVKYIIGQGGYFGDRKYGLATVDEVIAMATQPGLFDPSKYRIQPGQLRR